MRIEEYASIYRDLASGAYIVQPFALGPNGKTACGNALVLHGNETDEKIGASVLATMERYRTQKFDAALAIRHDRNQQREFVAGHVAVSISRLDSGDIVIRPLHHERGGFVARDEEAISLKEKVSCELLGAAIRDAFNQVS